jgi:hypothetical protein
MNTGQIAVIVALALGTAWYLNKPQPKTTTKTKPKYVGSGWLWPHVDRFPTEVSFGEALRELGYGAAYAFPNYQITSPSTMTVIRLFQESYENVRKAIALEAPGVVVGPVVHPSGHIDEKTIDALIFALDWQRNNPDDTWIALAQDAKNALK